MQVFLSPQAISDMEAIGDYIAQDNPQRAISFVRDLKKRCQSIGLAPMAYRRRPELGAGFRSCPHGSYVIFYQSEGAGVTIVRVLHAAMDLPEPFEQKPQTT